MQGYDWMNVGDRAMQAHHNGVPSESVTRHFSVTVVRLRYANQNNSAQSIMAQ